MKWYAISGSWQKVNDSKGVEDAVNKAKQLGKETKVKKYYVD